MPTYKYRGPTSDALANQYASRYRGPTNPYAQPRKSTTVKYLGSAKATNDALPQSRLNTLNRVYNNYMRPNARERRFGQGQYGARYAGEPAATAVSPVPGVRGANRPADPRQSYTPVLFSSPFAAGGYFGSTAGMYQPELTNYVQNRGFGKAPQGRGEQPLNAFMNDPSRPYMPNWVYNLVGPYDPAGLMRTYADTKYQIGNPKAMPKTETPQPNYGYTDLQTPLPDSQGYGGGGGLGYYYGSGGGYGGGGYGGGSYDRSAPSGAAPEQSRAANVQYAGRGQQGYQPGYQLPQWYRKLLSWNF